MWRRKKIGLRYKPLKKPEYRKIETQPITKKPEQLVVKKIEQKPAPEFRGHFMKRNVNFSLFFLIIMILGSLIVLTSYYQNTYVEQSKRMQEKSQEFDAAIEELRAKRVTLNETSYQLQIEAESKEKLGTLYSEIKDEKERLNAELRGTKQELASTLITLESARDELQATEVELEEKKSKLEELEEDVVRYEDKIEDLDKHMTDVVNKINELIGSSLCANEHQSVLGLVNMALKDKNDLKEIR